MGKTNLMLKHFFGKHNQIRFSCMEEDWDIIPKPYPSKKFIPDWFKALPMRINNEEKLNGSTVKRCVPFLDAMTIGYIIPLAADIQFTTNDDASGLEYFSKFYKDIVGTHGKNQITSERVPNPKENLPPMKFINYWKIKTPPGWSTLFIPPINREDSRFTCIGGLVDTDVYDNFINFPFFFNQPNFTGILESGTPLVQAISIKRDSLLTNNIVEVFSKKDYVELEKTQKQLKTHESHYRDNLVSKK
jgi:hypothetical protein